MPSVVALRLTVAALLTLVGACDPGMAYHGHTGLTMGTYYSVSYAGGPRCDDGLATPIERELAKVNAQMSTYLPDSEVSRFNASASLEWIPVSDELAQTVAVALELSTQSDGAFDVTVGPLVNAWGFGPEDTQGAPSDEDLASVRTRVGFDKLSVDIEDLYIDLSAIAKGHGVDRVAKLLERHGCEQYLVDIGGEVRTRGQNSSGTHWRVGIELPDGSGSVERVLHLSGQAAATSGDYRNFIVASGSRLSHTIDPRNGRPVDHGLASVTVVAATAELADAYATLINVLGPDAGLSFATSKGLAVFVILRGEAGFEERYTAPMAFYLRDLE
jgi:thiamine biosynthesis lipoprotein